MAGIDFKKQMKELYQPPQGEFTVVDVPELQYLMIDGHGDPNATEGYQAAINALYALAYGIRAALKDDPEHETWVVPPLEGLWWTDDMAQFSVDRKDDWSWTMMILQPDWVIRATFEEARATALGKQRGPAETDVHHALEQVRLATYDEGRAAQTLYVGRYDDEAPTIAALHDFIQAQGYRRTGKHHEIYLTDRRRTEPDKLKTVLRQPVAPAEA